MHALRNLQISSFRPEHPFADRRRLAREDQIYEGTRDVIYGEKPSNSTSIIVVRQPCESQVNSVNIDLPNYNPNIGALNVNHDVRNIPLAFNTKQFSPMRWARLAIPRTVSFTGLA
jgi:hypothetical protein